MDNLATISQRYFIKLLCDNLGYDYDNYLSVDLTKQDASEIITELKNEWAG